MSAPGRRRCVTVTLAFLLAACQPAASSVAPSPTPAAAATSSGASASQSGASAGSSELAAGQTDTDWGRIWDALPADFPSYPGATPAEGAAAGPASAVLAVPGNEAKTVVEWMRTKLEGVAYTTEALSGPLEDGSFVLEMTGSAAGCRVQVSVGPLGGLTTLTVRYGASCPQP
jgi:hypothetical protein